MPATVPAAAPSTAPVRATLTLAATAPDDANEQASQRLALWLSAIAQGDAAAFRHLHDATRSRLLGIALEVLGDRDRAEEAVQDAYLKVWHHAGSFDARLARPMTWLMRITRNRAIDLWRSRSSEAQHLRPWDENLEEDLAQTLVDPRPQPEQLATQRQTQAHAEAAIARLPRPLRQTVAMAWHAGLDAAEIAARCGVTPDRVRARLRQGIGALRQELRAA